MANKKSEDVTVKVGTGQQAKLKMITEAEVVDELMTIVETAFETCDFDDSIIKKAETGFGAAPNELKVTLNDGSVFVLTAKRAS